MKSQSYFPKRTVFVFPILLVWAAVSWAAPPLFGISDAFLNTASGSGALSLTTTGENNSAFGANAGHSNSIGNGNSAFGTNTLTSNTSGSFNTANGLKALLQNTTGTSNTAMGVNALSLNTNGGGNTAIGVNSLIKSRAGSENSALGYQTLVLQTSGSNNLALGANAGGNLTSGSSNIYLSNLGASSESGTIRIGNSTSHSRTFIAGIRGKTTGVANATQVFIDINGQLGTTNSSARFKKEIKDMGNSSQRLLDLRPVTYRYRETSEDGKNPLEYGLIAEEVEKIYPDLVVYGADGKIETVQYHKLTPMLLNEVQRLHKALASERQRNESQNLEIANLKQQMNILQANSARLQAVAAELSRVEARQFLGMSGSQ